MSDRGEPYQGVPRRTQSCKKRTNNNRASKRNDKRFNSLARLFALDKFGLRHAAISSKLRPRIPAGGLRAAFPYFWVAPEAQRG